jgi:uncharacterized Zn-binding protein involved in type VI secretion
MSLQPVARIGDPGDHGGQIVSGASTTTVDGLAIARVGDLYDCPRPGHGVNPIVSGSAFYSVEGNQVARVTDRTACGAVIAGGSPTLKAS